MMYIRDIVQMLWGGNRDVGSKVYGFCGHFSKKGNPDDGHIDLPPNIGKLLKFPPYSMINNCGISIEYIYIDMYIDIRDILVIWW